MKKINKDTQVETKGRKKGGEKKTGEGKSRKWRK